MILISQIDIFPYMFHSLRLFIISFASVLLAGCSSLAVAPTPTSTGQILSWVSSVLQTRSSLVVTGSISRSDIARALNISWSQLLWVSYPDHSLRTKAVDINIALLAALRQQYHSGMTDDQRLIQIKWQSWLLLTNSTAPILSGMKIFTSVQTGQVRAELPYYYFTDLSSKRKSQSLSMSTPNSYTGQFLLLWLKFTDQLDQLGVVRDVDPDTKISEVLINRDEPGRGMRSVILEHADGRRVKLIRNYTHHTYVYPRSWKEATVSPGDKIFQLMPDEVWDLDSIGSTPVERVGKTSSCVKTKRHNLRQFGIQAPRGEWAYDVAHHPHMDSHRLWQSRDEFSTLQQLQASNHHRREMLDVLRFTTGTKIIEVTWHSNSVAWSIYGHTNVWIVIGTDIRFLDPYVEVPGYAWRQPKHLRDFIRSRRARTGLYVAQVDYYGLPYEIAVR